MIKPGTITTIRQHLRLLGHKDHGVTEFRVFKSPMGPMVAYADNEDDAVHLCLMMASQTSGIYISVQPRPLFLFDAAPNQWKSAFSRPGRNCACDKDIEYITALFFDVDVMSKRRRQHPDRDSENFPDYEDELVHDMGGSLYVLDTLFDQIKNKLENNHHEDS